jgi:hypothetical protein
MSRSHQAPANDCPPASPPPAVSCNDGCGDGYQTIQASATALVNTTPGHEGVDLNAVAHIGDLLCADVTGHANSHDYLVANVTLLDCVGLHVSVDIGQHGNDASFCIT